MDFDVDDDFHPGMANVLQMKYNEQFGRHFIAKCDIDVGKVILVDEAFVTSSVFETGMNICDTCFKHMNNFVACQNCTFGLFCDEICSKDVLHKLQCGRRRKGDDILVGFALRSIGCALNIFPAADDLMNFVENVIHDPKKMTNVPSSIIDVETKYRLFLTLNLSLSTMKMEDLIAIGHKVFEILMN